MAFTRKVYAGAATVTTITAGVTSTATSFTIDDTTGWPSGGEFTVVVDFDTASEEKFLADGRTGNTVTLSSSANRGIDGTSAQTHNAGAKICPTLTAGDLDEANYTVVNTVGKVTTKGDMLAATSNATFGRIPAGTNGQLLQVDTSTTTGLKYGALPDGSIDTSQKFDAGVVDSAALATNSVTTVKITAANVTEPKLADDAVSTRTIAADAVTGAELADDAVGSEHLEDDAVGTANVQALAITDAELAANAVTTTKILDGAVTPAKTAETAWTSFSGSAISSGLSISNGSIAARYMQRGNDVHVQMHIILGSGSAVAGQIVINLPTAAVTATAHEQMLLLKCFDSNAGTSYSGFVVIGSGGTTGGLFTGAAVTQTSPFTWATSDSITISGTYEAA